MKGEETLVGRGVRSMTPRYRLVLTATPVKNRLPDIFRLAWWAVGGHAEAHARSSPTATNPPSAPALPRPSWSPSATSPRKPEAKRTARRPAAGRFKKLTAEVCNVHRLWKLFGPIILRRRKQDAGEEIVPKVRKVIRCEMGTLQKKVYQYHLDADYRDVNGRPAIGAQLQALRIAAADPSSDHLVAQPGEPADLRLRPRQSIIHTRHSITPLPDLQRPRLPSRCPHRSGTAYIPKAATVLTLIAEILERREQARRVQRLQRPAG